MRREGKPKSNPPQEARSVTVTAEQAGRADLVVQAITNLSRRQVRGLFDHGCVFINGAPCIETFARVVEGDAVEVRYDVSRRYAEKPKHRPDPHFNVVFEDEHVIVVEKAAGILSVPEDDGPENALINRVSLWITHGQSTRKAFACHRLDREVSGLLVFAKTQIAADGVREQFKATDRAAKPKRTYIAIVAGHMPRHKGTFRSHLATAGNLSRYSVDRQGARPNTPAAPNDKKRREPSKDDSQLAVTHYRVLDELDGASVVDVELETGRRNQIRVHFAEAHHPVLGEKRYRAKLARHPQWLARRLALHAATLAFRHPVTGKVMSFESPLPREMDAFIRHARNQHGRR